MDSSEVYFDSNETEDNGFKTFALSVGSTTIEETASNDGSALDNGEWEMLVESLDELSFPLAPRVEVELKRNMSLSGLVSGLSGESFYRSPLSPDEAERRVPEGEGGLVYHALVIPDAFFSDGKLARGLDKRDFDVEKQAIKPRRPSLPITSSDLFQSLTKVEGSNGHPRYIFHGVLNGWPALRCFELVALEQRRQATAIIPSPREVLSGQIVWQHVWKSHEEGARGIPPALADQRRIYRVTLRGASWTGRGWAKNSPGFVYWYEPHRPESQPRITYGSNMLVQLADDSKCTHISMLSHRYAVKHETPRDRITYHSVCLLEWEHGNYCTVVECAYLNGIGGYRGRSNWFEDRDEPICNLYRSFPPEMVSPWRMTSAEIRCFDVPCKTLAEFKNYVYKHEGKDGRFVDPQFTFSHKARLTFRSKSQIAQYLLNYIQRDSSYAELKRNCQTFVADLCAFVAGKKDVVPFHPVSRIEYSNRTYLFLYEPDMYESKEDKKKKRSNDVRKSTTSATTSLITGGRP